MAWIIQEYLTSDGSSPFRSWLDSLDLPVKARIQARILRFEVGNLGDHKSVGGGVWEARFDFGPGYRLYFGKVGEVILLLLAGGAKRTQSRDIERAKESWVRYLKEKEDDEEE